MEVSTTEVVDASPLPRGRHRLTREVVRSSQRRRMLDALTIAVARDGYPATSVADVIALAGVSRRTYYEHFRDKEECYLAAFEEAVGGALAAVAEGTGSGGTWADRVRGGLHAYLAHLASNPEASRAFIVEVLAAGPRSLEQRNRVHATFAEFLKAARREAGHSLRLPDLPNEAFALMVGGIEHVVAQEIRAGRTERLLELEEPLLYIQLALFAGHRVAATEGRDRAQR